MFRAYQDVGIRADVSVAFSDLPYQDDLPFAAGHLPPDLLQAKTEPGRVDEILELWAELARRHHGRVRFVLSPSAPLRCSTQFLERAAELSERLERPVLVHLLETRLQALAARQHGIDSLAGFLDERGLLGERTLLFHAVSASEADVQRIALRGARVVHCPGSNMKLGSGVAPVRGLLEAKSGYGLDRDNELRLLTIVDSLRGHPVDLVSTYLGAHVQPADYVDRRDQYVDLVVRTLPEAAELAEYCDVCVDPVGFTPAEAQRIAERAINLGMGIRVHADQTGRAGGARFAAENRAASADHLDFASREDLARMAEASTVAVVLPSLNYHLLELTPGLNGEPPVKGFFPGVVATMFDVGLRVALSTDYNPGTSPNVSMQTVLQLAARFYRLGYGQIWQMATINAAVALGRAHDRGSVEVGKLADLAIRQVPEHGMVINRFGTNLVHLVIKSGVIVVDNSGWRSPVD